MDLTYIMYTSWYWMWNETWIQTSPISQCMKLNLLYYIDQTFLNSLHGRLNCEIGGLDWHVITTEYRTCHW